MTPQLFALSRSLVTTSSLAHWLIGSLAHWLNGSLAQCGLGLTCDFGQGLNTAELYTGQI